MQHQHSLNTGQSSEEKYSDLINFGEEENKKHARKEAQNMPKY